MKRLVVIATLGLAVTVPAKANELFMGVNWNRGVSQPNKPLPNWNQFTGKNYGDGSQAMSVPYFLDPASRSEDTFGVSGGKKMVPSKQYYAAPYVPGTDGICDAYTQPQSWMTDGQAAYIQTNPTQHLYTGGRGSCQNVYYPGWSLWGPANMALAPHYVLLPFVPGSGVWDSRWGGQ